METDVKYVIAKPYTCSFMLASKYQLYSNIIHNKMKKNLKQIDLFILFFFF